MLKLRNGTIQLYLVVFIFILFLLISSCGVILSLKLQRWSASLSWHLVMAGASLVCGDKVCVCVCVWGGGIGGAGLLKSLFQPKAANSQYLICKLHTHSQTQTSARVDTLAHRNSPFTSKLLLWSSSLFSLIKNRQDEGHHFTHRLCLPLFLRAVPLINHSSLPSRAAIIPEAELWDSGGSASIHGWVFPVMFPTVFLFSPHVIKMKLFATSSSL